jgi:hypothetical protein
MALNYRGNSFDNIGSWGKQELLKFIVYWVYLYMEVRGTVLCGEFPDVLSSGLQVNVVVVIDVFFLIMI